MSVVIYGPAVDEFGNPVYSDKDVARKAVSDVKAVDFRVGSQVYTVGAPDPSVISIEYGLFLCPDGRLRVAVFEYCAELNATACEYGGWYTGIDATGCKLIAYAGTRVVEGRERRFVAVLDEQRNAYNVFDAPVALEFTLSDGRRILIEMGPSPIGIALLLLLGIGATIAAWGWKTQSEAQLVWSNTIREGANYCMQRGDTRCVVELVKYGAAVKEELNAFGWLDKMVQAVTQLPVALGALAALIPLVIRMYVLKAILSVLRGLFERR